MKIDKTNNAISNPSFQAKLAIEPKVLKYLISKDFDRNQGRYIGLFDYQYSPLEQRNILYNVLKHIKKDKTHKTVEIGGGYWKEGDHTVHMNVDGKLDGRWRSFHEYSMDSVRSDYIEKILYFAREIYPKAKFFKNSKVVNIINKLAKRCSKSGSSRQSENLNVRLNRLAKAEFDRLGKEIEALVKGDDKRKSFIIGLKNKLCK